MIHDGSQVEAHIGEDVDDHLRDYRAYMYNQISLESVCVVIVIN